MTKQQNNNVVIAQTSGLVHIDKKANGSKKPVIMSQDNKRILNVLFKDLAKSCNKAIATLSQNKINPGSVGSIKSLKAQLNSLQSKIDGINLRLNKSIVPKGAKATLVNIDELDPKSLPENAPELVSPSIFGDGKPGV